MDHLTPVSLLPAAPVCFQLVETFDLGQEVREATRQGGGGGNTGIELWGQTRHTHSVNTTEEEDDEGGGA